MRAFDARTGAEMWEFESVPKPGEAGHETWASDAWRDRPQVLHWPFSFTIDADRALLYASFASPGPGDHYGGDRPGDNLFGNSIVALDARTGERRWHFQTVHHDIWDYDLPAPPGLLDVAIDGASVPVLAQAGKTGYLYVLNRVTGKPVFGIEERPTPQSDVPGEKTSPTQPIPVKPAPLARVTLRARRHRDGGGDQRRARRVLPRAARAQRRIAQRGPVHAVSLSRGGQAAAHDDCCSRARSAARTGAGRPPILRWVSCS